MQTGRDRMSEPELLDRMQLVADSFRPAAPIDRRNLFAGRADQISEVFSVVAQPGQHAVIYGERGVGKTSLAVVTAELLEAANVLTARATCDVSDDFSSVWRKALGEIEFRSSRQAVGFTAALHESSESAATRLGAAPVTPDAVRAVLQRLGQSRSVAIFIDEFDRLRDPNASVLFADTIKALSDRVVRATLFLIGVADDIAGLIREHRSIERAIVQIHMPRMSASELGEIASTGLANARMTIVPAALKKVTAVSQGLPHYTQLLTQLAARAALADHRARVGGTDVDSAVERAIERAQGSVVEAYRQATAGSGGAIYPQVLLACALAGEDEFGFFGTSMVSEPLSRILGKPCKPLTFARHLDRMSGEARGAVLQKHGAAGSRRYRFENPLLQPYVLMRGLSDGTVRFKDLV